MVWCVGKCRVPFAPCLTSVFSVVPQPLGLTLESGFQPDMMLESVIKAWYAFINDVVKPCRYGFSDWPNEDMVR